MKKIAFMFVAAAMFTACGNTQKPAEVVEAPEAPVVELTAEDTAAALTVIGVEDLAAAMEADSTVATRLQVALDSILAAKMVEAGEAVAELPATEEVAAEEAPATEEAPAEEAQAQ
ncbi:MAG: hypothetical protein IJ605_04865 [Prevotella sp.]|nr:hypothetical protein [Prevotella sp.]